MQSTTKSMEALVEYGAQRKLVKLDLNEGLRDIRIKINHRFQYNDDNEGIQIQYFDLKLRSFLDLDDETWLRYKQQQKDFNKDTPDIIHPHFSSRINPMPLQLS